MVQASATVPYVSLPVMIDGVPYLDGGPDGKVVFSTTINAPGKSADQVFDIVKAYLEK